MYFLRIMVSEGFHTESASKLSWAVKHAKFIALGEMLAGAGLATFGGPAGILAGVALAGDGFFRFMTSFLGRPGEAVGVVGFTKSLVKETADIIREDSKRKQS